MPTQKTSSKKTSSSKNTKRRAQANENTLRQRELVLLSHVLGKRYLNNKFALRILPSKYIEQSDRSKVSVYSKLSFIQERKPMREVQLLDTPVKSEERRMRQLPQALRKTLPNIDELIKNNDDDMEDAQGNSNNDNVIEFYFQTLKQLVLQVRQDAQLVEKNVEDKEAESQIDYVHTDYITYVLKYRFRNLQANQYNKQSMLQIQYAIYLVYVILFKNNQIQEMPYSDELYAVLKKVFLPPLKELCYKIFDKTFSFDDEIKKFESFISDTIQNIDEKVKLDTGEEFMTDVEDGELTDPEDAAAGGGEAE